MLSTYSVLDHNIRDKLENSGVEGMSPHYDAIRDGNGLAMPRSYFAAGLCIARIPYLPFAACQEHRARRREAAMVSRGSAPRIAGAAPTAS